MKLNRRDTSTSDIEIGQEKILMQFLLNLRELAYNDIEETIRNLLNNSATLSPREFIALFNAVVESLGHESK